MQTVKSFPWNFIASLVLAAALPCQAFADLQIRLNDGRVISVPVDQAEVDSMTYKKDTASRPLAKRAADRLREDANQVRFASEAARKAAQAAARADAAAKEAVAAAAAARQAASEAATLAAEAGRVAHKPSGSVDLPLAGAQPPRVPPKAAAGPLPDSGTPQTQTRSGRRILAVGPGKEYSAPSEAAKAARDGDIVEIQAGNYIGDVAVWRANNLVIRGVGGQVKLDAAGQSARGKGIWVIQGRNTTVQHIAFTGARVPDRNGAGIRSEGSGLVIQDCEFYDNEMGILAGTIPDSDILIERSRFYRNTVDYPKYGKLGHNIYVGGARSLTIRFSLISGAQYGHNVKSWARSNRIAYNRIVDGRDGLSSYLLDLHGTGKTFVIGNILQQGPRTENWTMVSIGAEDPAATDTYYFVNNTFVNDRDSGNFVHRRSPGETVLTNNIFVGGGDVLVGKGRLKSNLIVDVGKFGRLRSLISEQQTRPGSGDLEGNLLSLTAGFVDPEKMDYRLREGSPAIDAGVAVADIPDEALAPQFEYRGLRQSAPRPRHGGIDIGAYEYYAD